MLKRARENAQTHQTLASRIYTKYGCVYVDTQARLDT